MDFSKQDGTTSVKVHHAPGGQSNFSLGWDGAEQPKKTQPKAEQSSTQAQNQNVSNQPAHTMQKSQQENGVTTSVKVHNPPGGKSNFSLG